MWVKMTVIPEVEAQYMGGSEQQKLYFQENVIKKIPKSSTEKSPKGVVVFTINEEGAITNALIKTSTGDAKTDELLLDAVNKMPQWKPAENSKGVKVKQDFEFSIGNEGC
jgi:TonB family protein